MDTFWLKIVGFAILVVGVIVLIGFLTSGTKEPEKTFYDQVEEDKQKFLAEPQPLEVQEKTQVPEQNQRTESEEVAESVPPAQKQVEEPKPTVLYFKPLSEIEQIEAQRLLNAAVPARSLGRLQIGFNLMMQNCRQILQRWPDSSYAYRAKKMIVDMPERFRDRYKVTKEELDLSTFAKPRPGTKPFTMEESR
jgi:hypothetical protein